MTTAILCALCLLARLTLCVADRWEEPAVEHCDLVEVNHFYDELGRLVFDQTIFFDWSPDDGRYMVRAWRLIKHPAQYPQRDWTNGGYVSVWADGEVMREIRCRSLQESWTQFDPELVEREFLPKERRRELRVVKVERPAVKPRVMEVWP